MRKKKEIFEGIGEEKPKKTTRKKNQEEKVKEISEKISTKTSKKRVNKEEVSLETSSAHSKKVENTSKIQIEESINDEILVEYIPRSKNKQVINLRKAKEELIEIMPSVNLKEFEKKILEGIMLGYNDVHFIILKK